MNEIPPVNVLILHEKPIVCAGIVATLAEVPKLQVLQHRPRRPDAMDIVHSAEVVVADYETALAVQKSVRGGRTKTVIVSQSCNEWEVRSALEAGVRGYLLLSCEADEVVRGVLKVSEGARYLCREAGQAIAESMTHERLSGREAQVLDLLAAGASNKRIASELGITVGTVKAHVKAILQKLDSRSRTEAASVATKRGLVLPAARSAMAPSVHRQPA